MFRKLFKVERWCFIVSSIKCNIVSCDNNTGFTNECIYGITDDLIKCAESGEPMCDVLRAKVLKEVRNEK